MAQALLPSKYAYIRYSFSIFIHTIRKLDSYYIFFSQSIEILHENCAEFVSFTKKKTLRLKQLLRNKDTRNAKRIAGSALSA